MLSKDRSGEVSWVSSGQGPRHRLLWDGLLEIHILKWQCPVSQNVIRFEPRALEEVIKATEDQK